jgi:hypothetical protein
MEPAFAFVFVVVVASKVERGFTSASKGRRKAATALPKAGAKRLSLAVVFAFPL